MADGDYWGLMGITLIPNGDYWGLMDSGFGRDVRENGNYFNVNLLQAVLCYKSCSCIAQVTSLDLVVLNLWY